MGLFVVPQVREGLEGFATKRTNMRPFACVCSTVFRQVHTLDETLSAHFTAKWTLTRVCAQVLPQVCVLTEALAAHLAGKRTFAGVDSLVKCNSGRGNKQFSTDRTLVGFRTLPGGAPWSPWA